MRVEVKNNDINAALRKLKKLLFKENVLKEYMAHCFYEKPSIKKRRRKLEAKRRISKENKLLREM